MTGEKKITDVQQIKPGSLMIIEEVACKVSTVDISKPGKHGHAKFRIVAVGLIDGKKRDVVMPHMSVEVPVIGKKVAQVLSISGDMANIMDSETFETFDLKIPEEMKDEVKPGVGIIYWEILDDKVMKQVSK